jgi:putative heme-binding domain-containing protein
MRLGLLALLLVPAFAAGQTDGEKIFAARCSGCHNTGQAPVLRGNRRVRARSIEQLRDVIEHGIPASGMPAFDLPREQLEAVAGYVRSLNSAAADNPVSGDRKAGEHIFFGSGQCSSCHMLNGRGSALGPDLSNVAHEMTAVEIRETLSHPDEHITPGYDLVTVELRDGRSVRGFARNRTNFDIQVQDLTGAMHSFAAAEIRAIREEKHSLMKPVSLNFQDLLAYLCNPISAAPNTAAHSENTEHGDWPTYNGKMSANRYSDLKEINTSNVAKLGLKWIFPTSHFGLETTPLVVDGVMYVTGANEAFALDAATGRQIWHYSRPKTQGLVGDASLGTNRGVALHGDKIFMVSDNAHLIALNRTTGSLVWEVVMPEEPQHYGSTVSPLVVKDMVIAGVSGADWGIRGFIACYKTSTGEQLWRHWTVPEKPAYLGGSTWLPGSYDAELDTLYWPTGNPWPDSDDRNRPGDNLYTNCVLALNPDTGALKWHYQFTPHDTHDRDATEPMVLVDTEFHGRLRKLLLHADRNGFFYVLDRTDGELLLAEKFLHRVNWASGIGPDGRPQLVNEKTGCPNDAANWGSTAFGPVTRLYYVMTLEECGEPRMRSFRAADRKDEPGEKVLRAIEIETGKVAWEVPQRGLVMMNVWPGVLGTSGGVLFYGDPNGAFVAADERSGQALWHLATNVPMKASPMTFVSKGRQFVAIAAGPNILCFGLP